MKARDYIKEAEILPPLSGKRPGKEFIGFYRENKGRIGDIIREQKAGDPTMGAFRLRAGMMDPKNAVVSEKIKGFCRLPYRTPEGPISACPGILWNWKGCAPHAPETAETETLLSRARSFLIVQFEGDETTTSQSRVHPFIAETGELLADGGYTVLQIYASGPCKVCPRGCGDGATCRQPARRLFALEACGFSVNPLCRASARYPVISGGPEEVEWIRDWCLPSQDTTTVRYTTGIVIG